MINKGQVRIWRQSIGRDLRFNVHHIFDNKSTNYEQILMKISGFIRHYKRKVMFNFERNLLSGTYILTSVSDIFTKGPQ